MVEIRRNLFLEVSALSESAERQYGIESLYNNINWTRNDNIEFHKKQEMTILSFTRNDNIEFHKKQEMTQQFYAVLTAVKSH